MPFYFRFPKSPLIKDVVPDLITELKAFVAALFAMVSGFVIFDPVIEFIMFVLSERATEDPAAVTAL